MVSFNPFIAVLGGFIIGSAALLFLKTNKRICGLSGIIQGCIPPYPSTQAVMWKFSFVLGLIIGGGIVKLLFPESMQFSLNTPMPLFLLAGFLVGFGTRLGMGCTSGHGVCGVGRMSPRSILATILFLGIGIISATIFHFFIKV